jgi:hypothetical protein
MHWPFAPEIGHSEGKGRPTPRSLSRSILRDVEPQANDGAGQPGGYSSEMMSRPRAGIQDVPRQVRHFVDMSGDHRRQGAEVARVEKLRTMAELRRAIAAGSRAASPAG